MALKFIERIALEQFNYLEVEADEFNELITAVKAAKAYYDDRLHKIAPKATYSASEPFSPGLGMKESGVTCDKCGAVMKLETKISKKNNKPYEGYFCPNSSAQDSHPIKFPPRK